MLEPRRRIMTLLNERVNQLRWEQSEASAETEPRSSAASPVSETLRTETGRFPFVSAPIYASLSADLATLGNSYSIQQQVEEWGRQIAELLDARFRFQTEFSRSVDTFDTLRWFGNMVTPQIDRQISRAGISLAERTRYVRLADINPESREDRLQTFASDIKENKMADSVSIGVTTGEYSNTLGSTILRVGFVGRGEYTSTEYWKANVTARLISRSPASSIGTRGDLLGQWFVRSLDMPPGTVFYVGYYLKPVSAPLRKELVLPFIADPKAPWIELTYPVIADTMATRASLPISGRFRLLTHEEQAKLAALPGHSMYPICRKSSAVYADWGTRLDEHWKRVIRTSGETVTAPFIQIEIGSSTYDITVRRLLPAVKTANEVTKKEITTPSQRKITLVTRARRVKLRGKQ